MSALANALVTKLIFSDNLPGKILREPPSKGLSNDFDHGAAVPPQRNGSSGGDGQFC